MRRIAINPNLRLFILLLVVSIGYACNQSPTSTNITDSDFGIVEISPSEDQDIREIYTLVLNVSNEIGRDPDVIIDRTEFVEAGPVSLDQVLDHRSKSAERTKVKPPTIGVDLRDNFVLENRSPSTVTIPADFTGRLRPVSGVELKSIFQNANGWTEFQRRFGFASILGLSKVGFNKERTEALVYMSRRAGLKNGEGNYFWIVRGNDGWRIVETIEAWVS